MMSKNLCDKGYESLESNKPHIFSQITNFVIGTVPAQWCCGFGWWPRAKNQPQISASCRLKNFTYRLSKTAEILRFFSLCLRHFRWISKKMNRKFRTAKNTQKSNPWSLRRWHLSAALPLHWDLLSVVVLELVEPGFKASIEGTVVNRSTTWKFQYASGCEPLLACQHQDQYISVYFEAGSLSTFFFTGLGDAGNIPKHIVYATLSTSANLSAAWQFKTSQHLSSECKNTRSQWKMRTTKTLYVIRYCNETSLWGF